MKNLEITVMNLANIVDTLLYIVDCNSYELLTECKETMKQLKNNLNEGDENDLF
jgi:hypothetical protein